MNRFEQQMKFILEIDKVKNVFRQTYLADGNRKENDAEHSWHMAIMAFLLKEYAQEEVDIMRVVLMVLTHDLVEIDAGDTYAYDLDGLQTKREREVKAAERIFGLLPKDQEEQFRELWDEFEAYESAEAKYAHMLDNFQPLMLNDALDGKSWKEHKVKKSQIYSRNAKTMEGSEKIWEYMKDLVQKNIDRGNIQDE
ncbi:HD domain-containing protein [Blautia hydrogenotrophica]|uniref:HD domain-containing protein n=1 Tax=Blautia hydrogenotrophica TaxID=53443 RepID=UPI003AB8C12B